jgi:phosphoribosylanthranilate isomerase
LKIKICGIFREQDIDYINEARPDYCGFVFAESKRQVSAAQAARLRQRLAEGITAVGVFVNAPIEDITALYRDGTINIAQLHGDETEEYIIQLKKATGNTPIPVIKVIKSSSNLTTEEQNQQITRINTNNNYLCHSCHSRNSLTHSIDYYLLDSGAGSGKTFDWDLLNSLEIDKPWFLAGGINMDNIEQAMAVNPFGIDISSGAETDGVKDREKILQLVATIRKGNMV